jgi:hypothetical protein
MNSSIPKNDNRFGFSGPKFIETVTVKDKRRIGRTVINNFLLLQK